MRYKYRCTHNLISWKLSVTHKFWLVSIGLYAKQHLSRVGASVQLFPLTNILILDKKSWYSESYFSTSGADDGHIHVDMSSVVFPYRCSGGWIMYIYICLTWNTENQTTRGVLKTINNRYRTIFILLSRNKTIGVIFSDLMHVVAASSHHMVELCTKLTRRRLNCEQRREDPPGFLSLLFCCRNKKVRYSINLFTFSFLLNCTWRSTTTIHWMRKCCSWLKLSKLQSGTVCHWFKITDFFVIITTSTFSDLPKSPPLCTSFVDSTSKLPQTEEVISDF